MKKNYNYIVIFLVISLYSIILNVHAAKSNVSSMRDRNSVTGIAALDMTEGKDHRGKDGVMAKAGYDLALIYQEHQEYKNRGGFKTHKKIFRSSRALARIKGEMIVIDAVATGNAASLLVSLEKLGLVKASVYGRIVSGYLPIASIKAASALTSIQHVRASYSRLMSGAVTSQGDLAQQTSGARNTFAVTGSGVSIATLSDSYNCLGGAVSDVSSGDLPPTIVVIAEASDCTVVTDEGRAMMQIIHDIAPSSTQYFHTTNGGKASFANGIISLKNAGANIINDDVLYFSEPMFQDGIIAQAIDTVKASGVAYFSAAGNYGSQSYESVFRDSGVKGYAPTSRRHDFNSGTGVDSLMQVTIPANAQIIFVLQWDDPFFSVSGAPGADTDMDVILYSETGQAIAGSTDKNIGGDAYEAFAYTNPSSQSAIFQLSIERVSGASPNLIKLIYFGNMVINEYATNSASLYGHAMATGAMAVGASRYTQTPAYGVSPPLLESFSSVGGTPTLFDVSGNFINVVRSKPEIVAPDGGDNTFFGSDYEGNGFPNFFGTSAATPHAAGMAALLKSFENTLTVDELYTLMKNSAVDMKLSGFDYMSGHGLINANAAFLILDTDADTIPNSRDNCVTIANTGQENNDQDSQGDVCDDDDDNDGVLDTNELLWGLDPFNPDTDGDTLNDGFEVCFDGDCLSYQTVPIGLDLNAMSNDTDGDGLLDAVEINLGTNPLVVEPAPQILSISSSNNINSTVIINGANFCVEQCGFTLTNVETELKLGCQIINMDSISQGKITFTIPNNAITSQIKITTPFGIVSSVMFNVNGTYQVGDVNVDGVLNVPDILISQQIIMNIIVPTAEQFNRADISPPCAADGLINASDLMLLQQKIILQ